MQQLEPFAAQGSLEINEASHVAAWICQAGDESAANRIGRRKHNWDRAGLPLQRGGGGGSEGVAPAGTSSAS